MRYYKIILTDPTSGNVLATFQSHNLGVLDPGALNIELDLPAYSLSAPMGAAYVRVWGISLKSISQSADFNNARISVYGGMQKGLPLANPLQSGLLVEGIIQQAFGNWQADVQTLDFLITASLGTPDSPLNIVFNWSAGQSLASAITATLATAFPSYTATINISSSLVLAQEETGYFQTLGQFAAYVKQLSQSIITASSYSGVEVVVKETGILVYDGTTAAKPTQIQFVDLIGQPTWIEFGVMQLRCVMRADVAVGDFIKMPQAQTTTTAASQSQYRNSSVFQGTFQVIRVRHVGNFRQPDANSWVTVIDAGIAS